MTKSNEAEDLTKTQDHLKSIVYGDVVKNKYGTFRCFCATVSQEDQINSVVDYLRKNFSFHKLSKFSYSYRITNQAGPNEKAIENCYNDARLDGCGEKILHLLQKFNVENVLLILGVEKKEIFSILSSEYYHTIIERAKDLLSTLYEKVLENDLDTPQKEASIMSTRDHIKFEGIRPKLVPNVQIVNFSNIPPVQTARKLGQVNSFQAADQKAQASQKTHLPTINDKERLLQSVLTNNLRRNYEKLRTIVEGWQENDYQHLRFINLYEKSITIGKVFKILMILDDVKHAEELGMTYDFQGRLPLLMNVNLTKEKCKKVTEMLRQDRSLNAKALESENHIVSSLLEYLTLIVRSYELSERVIALDFREKSLLKRNLNDFTASKATLSLEDAHDDIILDLTKGLTDSSKGRDKAYQGDDDSRVATIPTEREVRTSSKSIIQDKMKVDEDGSAKKNLKLSNFKQSNFYTKAHTIDPIQGPQSYTIEKQARSGTNSEDNSYMEPKILENVIIQDYQVSNTFSADKNDRKRAMLVGNETGRVMKPNESISPQKVRDILFAQKGMYPRINSLEALRPNGKLPALVLKSHDFSARSQNISGKPTLSQTKSERYLNDFAQSEQGVKGYGLTSTDVNRMMEKHTQRTQRPQIMKNLKNIPTGLTASKVKSMN